MLRAIARALDTLPATIRRSLYVVTRPAAPSRPHLTAEAAIREAVSSITRDHPALHLPRISLHPGDDLADDARRLARELLA
ncbi:hypothetical protein FAF44_52870, partial [Nonomuraea sp. MG754425]|uniref:hypothetical protein n=1 Tax=Nonomuraea sp. MG754425 TaxID=2570319 RepID=UPI001F314FDF